MPEIGDLIFKMLGRPDPREQLAAAMAGGGGSAPGTPQPAGGTSSGAGTPPGTATPAAPVEAPVYQSPQDLYGLYSKLLDRQEQNDAINRGIGLIGISLAQPQNKSAIASAFLGGSNASDPSGLINNLMQFRTQQASFAQKEADRARLPAIAKQFGLDENTVQYLFDTGQLDNVLQEAMKPDNQIVTDANGQFAIVDKKSGKVGPTFGPKKPQEVELVDDGLGGKIAVDKNTKQRVGGGSIDIEGHGNTEQQKNWEAAMLGLPPEKRVPLDEWIKRQTKLGSGSNLGADDVNYGDPPKDMAWVRGEDGKVKTKKNEKGQDVPIAAPISGGPADTAANKQNQRNISGTVVGQSIDDALKQIDTHKNDIVAGTGWGSFLKGLPGTDANALSKSIDTIKANIGIDKMNEMRQNSATGATGLGAMSDFENRLLQSTLASLDQDQDPATLSRNLRRVRAIYSGLLDGSFMNGDKPNQDAVKAAIAAADAENNTADEPSIDDLIKKYR